MKLFILTILFLPLTVFSQKVDSRKIARFFSKVDHVELCEINKHLGPYLKDSNGDSSRFEEFLTIIHEDSIDFSQIRKRTEINDSSISVLKNALLNTKTATGGRSFCYEPRNGILFYDQNNELIAYLELCFSCTGYCWFNQPWNSEVTDPQIMELKKLFLELGMSIYY